jgi:hypothetical protein
MKISELIVLLKNLEDQYGDVEVSVKEVKNGNNASDRYGVGCGLKVGEIEIKELQEYVYTVAF